MSTSPKTQFATVNGIKLAYNDWHGEPATAGRRGPLVCIPSITGHKGTFTALAERLAPQYRVLALDLRGRCDSDKPESGYGFAYHARDIIAFADAMGFEKFTLVGHSFGATASVYTAALHPSRISSLVLLDGGADPKHETLKAMYPTVKRLNKTYQSMDEYLKVQRAITYHKPWTQALERYVSEEMQTDGVIRTKSSPTAIEHDLDMHFWDNVWFYLLGLKCPVLYLRPQDGLLGNTGHVYSDAEAAKLAEQMPNCKYEIVPGGNHYTFVIQDEPPVLPYVEKFLAEQYA